MKENEGLLVNHNEEGVDQFTEQKRDEYEQIKKRVRIDCSALITTVAADTIRTETWTR